MEQPEKQIKEISKEKEATNKRIDQIEYKISLNKHKMECINKDSQYKLQAMNSCNMKVCKLREILDQREDYLKRFDINKNRLKVHLRNQKYQNQINFQSKDDFVSSLSKGLEKLVSKKIFDIIINDYFTKSIREDGKRAG